MNTRTFYYCTFLTFFVGGVLFLGILGCEAQQKNETKTQKPHPDSVQFTHKSEVKYADGFRISYHQNYKLLEVIKPFQDKVDTLRYALVPREMAGEIEVGDATTIPIPIESLLTTSTTHVGLADMIDATEVITGMAGADYVYHEGLQRRLQEGEVLALPQGELNKEEVLSLNPDLLMVSGGQASEFDNLQMLMDSDIEVLVNSEWLETTPLGKAEWVKVLGVLLDKEKLANEKFEKVRQEYHRLKSIAEEVSEKPMVINNMPYKGAWFVSGGNSFTAQFLKDAGADYPWFDSEEEGGLRKSFEVVYELGLEAEFWINPGAAESKDDIVSKDSRFKDFKSVKTGEIYNNNKRMSSSGGNDFWESGVVHPERVLADLIKIFHPELLPEHSLYYYQQID
ncbi:MAG: ABC transporter substrate-binding protein [Bacteroidota bacterium]